MSPSADTFKVNVAVKLQVISRERTCRRARFVRWVAALLGISEVILPLPESTSTDVWERAQ